MVKLLLPKQVIRVRFPLPAPHKNPFTLCSDFYFFTCNFCINKIWQVVKLLSILTLTTLSANFYIKQFFDFFFLTIYKTQKILFAFFICCYIVQNIIINKWLADIRFAPIFWQNIFNFAQIIGC